MMRLSRPKEKPYAGLTAFAHHNQFNHMTLLIDPDIQPVRNYPAGPQQAGSTEKAVR